MATVVGKSRNPILNAAWAAHIKAQRAGTKAAKEAAPAVPAKQASQRGVGTKSAKKKGRAK